MLLNEPTPHQARPAAAAAAAAASTRELPAVEIDGAPARVSDAEADTVAFTAVDAGGANGSGGASTGNEASADAGDGESPSSNTEAPTVGIVTVGSSADVLSTVALDVDAVKRALAEGLSEPDATDTVSLDVAGVKRAAAQAPTVAFAPVEISADGALADARQPVDAAGASEADESEPADESRTAADDSIASADTAAAGTDAAPESDPALVSEAVPDSEPSSSETEGPAAADSSAEFEPSGQEHPSAADSSAGFEPSGQKQPSAADSSTGLVPSAGTEVDSPAPAYLASTHLATSASTLVAVPETADDVIATIHAAATAVAEADRRARKAAVAKADPWTGLDLHQPAVPAPVDNVLDLLSPVLERPLLVVEQPGLPAAADVVALHRSELEVDFVEPPVVAAGAEPPIPPRYGPGLSVLPHIEFPV